jgi:hypothetical protein
VNEKQNEHTLPLRQICFIGTLVALVTILLGFKFTARTHADKERERARILLQSVYRLERAYHWDHGTYLPIDRERNSDLLKLDDLPGGLRFRVETEPSNFIAYVEADPTGNGITEVWRIDARSSRPVPLSSLPTAPAADPGRTSRTPP